MRRALLPALLSFALISTLSAQSHGRSSFGHGGPTRFSAGPGLGHSGFFSGFRNGRQGNRAARAFFFADRWLDQGRVATHQLANPDYSYYGGSGYYYGAGFGRPFAFDPGYGIGYGGYPGSYGGYYGPSPPSTWNWVGEWRDRPPAPGAATDEGSSLARSVLLAEGMSDEEVMQILGAPIERIGLARNEVWKYSSYSLFFEGGKLKEMR